MSKSIDPMWILKPGAQLFPASPRSHRFDEFAIGYSLAVCSPALPASASPIGSIFKPPEVLCQPVPSGNIKTGLEGPDKAKYQLRGWAKSEYRSGPDRSIKLSFEKIYQRYGTKMQIVAVNAGIGDEPRKVRRFVAEAKMRMPVAIDDGSLTGWLNLDSTPFHLLIGMDGRIAYAGHQDGQQLDAALERVLAGKPETRIETTNVQDVAALRPGDLVPSIDLRGPDNSPVELVRKGRPRALLFTATWCESYLKDTEPKTVAACRRAREQADEMSQNGSVAWLGVVTRLWTTPKALASYQTRMKPRVPMAVDTDGQAFRAFGIQALPAVALIDADGRLFRILGPKDNDLTRAVGELAARHKK